MSIRISVKEYFFIVSSVIILTTRFWGENVNYILRYSLMAVWDLYFALSYFSHRNKSAKNRVITSNFWLMVIPYICIFAYTIIIWAIQSSATFLNFSRLCSTFLYLILAYGYACTAIYLFREKGIDYLFWAGVCSYFCGSVLYLLVRYGFMGMRAYITTLIFGESSIANYAMEVHDLTFAMGIFLLYYMFFEDKSARHHKAKIVLSIILILLGLKRIEMLALCIAVLLYFVLIKWGKGIKVCTIVCGVAAVVISLVYIYVIDSGMLSALLLKYGIQDNGRLSYYLYANKFYEYSIDFVGLGWTWFSRYFQQLYLSGYRIDGYRIAASIHSDILVMFIEIGFVLFVVWVFYMFITRTNVVTRKFGAVAGECVLLLTLYMFILYLTDNTITYTDTQTMFILAPMTAALKSIDSNSEMTGNVNIAQKR